MRYSQEKWKETRGIVIASVGVNSVSASKEDEDMIKQLQKSAVMRDPTMAGLHSWWAHRATRCVRQLPIRTVR